MNYLWEFEKELIEEEEINKDIMCFISFLNYGITYCVLIFCQKDLINFINYIIDIIKNQ